MKVCCALATAALLVLSAIPVDAQTIYPTQRCRVYERHGVHSNCGSVRDGCVLLPAPAVCAISEAAVVLPLAHDVSWKARVSGDR